MSLSSSKVVREWLHEYKSLPEAEMHTYANTIRAQDELIATLYQLFDEERSQEVVDVVCHQLFDFYRSGEPELKRFTLELVPTMVWTYLSAISVNNKKKCGGIEACLLGIYNLEIVNKDGSPCVSRFTIPTLACPSIYHEPPSLATLALTESALLRYHSDEHVVINTGPLPQVESVNAQNRLAVLSHVISCYTADIANLSPRSHQALCKMCSKIAKTGFDDVDGNSDGDWSSLSNSGSSSASSRGSQTRGVKFLQEARIPLNSTFLVELLSSIYFVMFNGHARSGKTAVEDVHERASYELWSDVLLVTNAIRNSLMYNPSGQPQDGPMGISLALSPTTSNPSFSKHAITNASFRAKKLPDDIEVPDSAEAGGGPPTYDEVLDIDRTSKTDLDKIKSSHMFSKPLKSIMKTGKDKIKIARKDSDARRKESAARESADAYSQRQSVANPIPTSQSLTLTQSFNNGAVVDVDNVTVEVVTRSSSRSKVDQVEMRPISGLQRQSSLHRRTASFPEGGFPTSGEGVGGSRVPGEAGLGPGPGGGSGGLTGSGLGSDGRATFNGTGDSGSEDGGMTYSTPL